MDFFDNALNKAKDAFDIARHKTDEVFSTQKQKFDIASLKRKRSGDFEELGIIYFKMIKDSEIEDDVTFALVESIKEKNAKIRQLREEIEAAKGRNNDEL